MIRRLGFALTCALVACAFVACSPEVRIDDGSPALASTSVVSGSELSESTQYVEARLSFDAAIESQGNVLSDLDVTLDGDAIDAGTISVSAWVDGTDVVVRLEPSAEAASGGSVYFALHDGQLSVASLFEDGALPHVRGARRASTAVLAEPAVFTVPSGMAIGGAERTRDGVSFDIERFAQVRCCTWFNFGEGLPLVKLHNHTFYRDTPTTVAERLAQTVNANYGDALEASCEGSRVVVAARGDVAPDFDAIEIVEGPNVDLSGDRSTGSGGVEDW